MMNYWDALSAIKNKIEMIKAEKANNKYLYEESKFKYLCFTRGVEYSFDELLENIKPNLRASISEQVNDELRFKEIKKELELL